MKKKVCIFLISILVFNTIYSQFTDSITLYKNTSFQSTTNSTGSNGDYINLPTLILDSNYTVETWFNLNASTGTSYPFIYNFGGWGNNSSNSNGLIINISNRNLNVRSWGIEANAVSPPNNLTGYSLVPGIWTHLAMVVRGRNTKVYVNGIIVKEYLSLGTPTNNNTFTNNRIGNGQDVGGVSTTLGQYRDFKIWKKARTTSEIQSTFKINDVKNIDSLYYYLSLSNANSNNPIQTLNIANNTSISNESKWSGALNASSTIISQAGTGAKYFYDSTNQKIYGTYYGSLQANEIIQISVDGGSTWKNADTAFNNNWVATTPTSFRNGVIKIRGAISNISSGRVFTDYSVVLVPTNFSYIRKDTIQGKSGIINVNTINTGLGNIKYYITSTPVAGIGIDSLTGQIQFGNILDTGLYTINVRAVNEKGSVSTNALLYINPGFSNKIGGFINNYLQTTTNAGSPNNDKVVLPSTLNLSGNITIELWYKANINNTIPTSFLDFRIASGGTTGFFTEFISGNRVRIYANNATGAIYNLPVGFDITAWHHYAVVSTTNLLLLYIDGVLIGSSANVGNIASNATSSNFIGSGNNANSNPATGQYVDFRIWKKAKTEKEIKENYTTPVLTNSDSLYYNLLLTKNNIGATTNIPSNTSINNVSKWSGALNTPSTIISQNNTGATYYFDSTNNWLYGTIQDTVQPNERLEYSIDGGLTWKNVDTVIGLYWEATLPTSFKYGTIQVRSNNNANRVFANYVFNFVPSIYYTPNNVIDTVGTVGSSVLPNIITIGTTRFSITSGGINGIGIDSNTGKISWSNNLPVGSYNLIITASNQVGFSTTNYIINIKLFKDTILYYSNNSFQSNTIAFSSAGDYINLPTLNLDSNYTVETWFNLNAFSGTNYPFIYSFGTWNNGLILQENRTLSVKSWGQEALTGRFLTAGIWNHLAVVVKGKNIKLYVNGVLVYDNPELGISSTNNNTFINNRIGNGQDVTNTSLSTTVGQYRDFRIWKKARTTAEIQATYKTNVELGWDSLYYNLQLTKNNIVATSNIPNNTSINNASKWFGAQNATSTIISLGGTGAKYNYDSNNQKLYGQIKDTLLAGEKIQISIDSGTSWVNVDTTIGTNWVATVPARFKWGRIQARSNINASRVFAHYVFYYTPSITYSLNNVTDTSGTTGESVLPTVKTSGTTKYYITSGSNAGIQIDSNTGKISWLSTLASGTYNLVISAINEAGPVTTNFSLTISNILTITYNQDTVVLVNYGTAGNSNTPVKTGGNIAATYSFSSTTPAVSGITINSSTGVISWSNTAPVGTYTFRVIATSVINADSSQYFRVRINSLKPILSYSLNPVRIDQGISDSSLPTINATGLPIRYKIIGDLVTGISIDSISGVIKWTSKVSPSIYSLIIQAKNSVDSVQTSFTLQINQLSDTILYFNNSAFQTTTSAIGPNGDYINLPTLNLDSNYTVETWFNLNVNTGTNFPFIYNIGGWANSNSNGLIINIVNRTLHVKSWGVEANGSAPNDLTGYSLVPGVWTHLAMVVRGRNTKVYVNGSLIKEYTSLGNTPTNNNTFTNNRIGNGRDVTNNNNTISTTLGQYRDFRIWKKVRSIGEIQATYRGNVLRNSDDLYYYLPLDNKLFTTRNVGNDSILSNYATATGSLNGTSTIISQNGRTGAKYFVDSTNQRLTGKYKDSLLAGETIQVSYDSGTTWRAVKYAANNNWYDSLTSVFNGGLIKVRSVIGGVPTTRYFADFIQYIKPTAPQLSFAASYEAGKALVNFGVPIKTGGTTINNYVVVSQPGNITSSSAGSPILITGLTNSTSYTFRVVANNVAGVSDSSVASNSVTPSSTYTITTSVKNGNINVGPISVNVGGSYRITYTGTNNNYTIDSIIINNTNVIDSTNGYTFNNIGTNNTIRVVYKIKTGLVRVNQGANGINTPFGINQVQYGSSLRVSYVSNRGYKVDSIKINEIYYGGGIDSGTYTFTNILGDSSINITYKLQTNTITSSTNNVLGGNININNSVVNYGGSALVSYAPNAGYYIDSVYINGVYNKDSLVRYTLNNITTNQEVRVIFRGYEKPDSVSNVLAQGGNEKAIITFTLPINIKNAGEVKYYVSSTPDNITASGIGSPLIVTGLTNGTSYTFIVQDSNAYGSSNSSISNAVIPTNGLVAILTSAGVGGVIQGSTNIDTSVIKTYRVTYTNQTGYILDSIIVNGVYKGKDSSVGYTFKNIGGDSLIRVVYKSQTYSITSSVNNVLGGSILPSGVNNVVYGSNPQYSIIPNAGYNVDSIKVNNVKVGVTGVYGFANITSANTIVAYFSKIQYNIVSAVVNGTINPVGTRVVGYDTTIRYTYSGNGGYILDSVIVNGEKVDSPSGYTFKNVRSNQNIRVKYKIPSYTITSIVNGPATITPLGNIQVISGGSASYNILGLTNIQIDSILVNNIKINNVTSYTFSNVTSNQSIVVYSKTILVLGKPQNILVQAQSSKQILISWQAPQNLGVGSILNYEITGISSRGIVSTQTTGGTSILFNVDSFYTYKFVVKARNVVGLSDGDTSQLFSTIRYIGIKPVLVSDNGLSKTDKISTDVRVKLSSQDSLLIPIGYGIIYSYDSGKTYTQQIYNGGNFIIPQQNNNLGNKNIIIRVILGTDTSAINEGINVVLATTPDKTTIKGVSKTGNQIQVGWVKPFDGGTGITGYEIQAISTIGDTIITNIDTVKTDTSYLIGRIKTNTGYKVTIKAINAIGKSITTDTSDNIFIFQTITPQLVNDNGVSTTDKITSDGRTYILPTGVFKDSLEANRFLIPLDQYLYLQEPEYYNNTLLTASYLTINGTIAKRCVKYYNLEPHPSFPITQNNCDTAGFKVVNISNNVPTGLEIKSNMVYKYSLDSGKTYVTPVSGVYTIPTSAGFGNKNTRVKLFLTDNSDSSDLGTGLSFTMANISGKPTNLIATKLLDTVNNKIQVSWKKPVDTGVIVIRNYNIIGIASNGANLSATALGTDTSYTFTNITNNVLYNFVVKASNDIGVSLSDTTKNTLVFIKPISPLVYNDNGVSNTDKITSDGRFYILPEVQPKLYQGGNLVDFGGKVIAFKNYTDAYNSIYGISQGSGYYARAYYLGENGDLRVTCKSPNNSYNIINESYPGGGAGCAGNYSIQYAQWLSVSNTTSVAVVPLGYNFKYIINNGADINPGSFINGLPNVAGTYSVKIKLSAPNNVDSVVGSPLVYTLITVPDAPTNVLAMAGDSAATISFVAPLNTGGLSIDSFKVVSTTGNKSITGNTSPIIIRGLQNNTAYSFAVTAFNNVGSSASITSNAVTPNRIYNITSTVVNGSILSNQSVIRFGSIRITYINNAGYILDSVIINGVYKGKDSVNGYTFKNVTNDSTIRVVYKILQYNLNIDIGNGGTSSQQTGIVTARTNINLNINANQNFIIDSIFVNSRKVYTFAGGQEIGLTSFTYLLNNILGDSAIIIKFRSITVPSKPSIDSVVAGNSQAVIYFKYPQNFGGANIGGYSVVSVGTAITASGTISPIIVTGLTNGNSYRFAITANNLKGSSLSDTSNSIIPNSNTQNISTLVVNGNISATQSILTGSNINITYNTSIGFALDSIIVDGISVDTNLYKQNYSFTNVQTPHSIKVYYKQKSYTITTNTSLGGLISASKNVYFDSAYTVTYGVQAGYKIDSVKVGGINQTIGNSYLFSGVRSAQSINLYTSKLSYQITTTVAPAGNGSITVGKQVYYDSSFTFTFSTNTGYAIDSITINGSKVNIGGNTYTITQIKSPQTIIVHTSIIKYTITTFGTSGVSISPSTTQNYGTSYTVNYAVQLGYKIDSVKLNDTIISIGTSYLFTNLNRNQRINVYASRLEYSVSTAVIGGAVISPSKNVYFDSSYTITYNFNTGYVIDSVKVNGSKILNINGTYTLSGVRSNYTIVVHTSKIQITLSATTNNSNGGVLTPAFGNTTVNYGDSLVYTLTINNAYILDTLYLDGNVINLNNNNQFVLRNITSTHLLRAIFKAKTVPSTPSILRAEAGNGQAIIYFNLSASNGGSEITNYTVVSSPDNKTATGATSPIIVNGLTNGTDYSFKVYATNVIGNSALSSSSTLIRPAANYLTISTSVKNGNISATSYISTGGNKTVTYTGLEGYILDSIYVNGIYSQSVTRDSTTQYTFVNVTATDSIRVIYKIKTYTITASAETGGIINNIGNNIVNYGSSLTFTITPNLNYYVDSIIVNDTLRSRANSYTFSNIKFNQNIRITFKEFSIVDNDGNGLIDITSVEQLNNIRFNLSGTSYKTYSDDIGNSRGCPIVGCNGYELKSNIDFKDTNSYISKQINEGLVTGNGWEPINGLGIGFNGVFEGNNYIINNLFINRPEINNVGLFGSVIGGSFKNLQLINGVVKGKNYVGMLIGSATDNTQIKNIKINNSVLETKNKISGYDYVGGLVGSIFNNSIIDSVSINVTIEGLGAATSTSFGLIAGQALSSSSIINSNVIGEIKTSGIRVGGAVGSLINNSTVSNVGVSAIIKANKYVGGVVGWVDGSTISNSYFIGNQGLNNNIVADSGYVGGVVGVTQNASRINNVYSRGAKITGLTRVAGLVASLTGNTTLTNAYATEGILTGEYVGGVVGRINGGSVQNTYSNLIIKGTEPNIGGLIGNVSGTNTINNNFWDINRSEIQRDNSILNKGLTEDSILANTGSILKIGNAFYFNQIEKTFTPKIYYFNQTNLLPDQNLDSVKINNNIITINWTDTNRGFVNQGNNQLKRLYIDSNANFTSIIDSLDIISNVISYTLSNERKLYLDKLYFKIVNIENKISTNVIALKDLVKKYKITTEAINGQITNTQTYTENTSPRILFDAYSGYELDSLFVDGNINTDSLVGYTFNSISENHIVIVKYKAKTYIINAIAGENGQIDPVGETRVTLDSITNFTITPNINYEIDSLIVNGFKIQNTNSYVFDSVKSNQTIRVTFKIKTYTITAIAGNGGSISAAGTRVVNYGARPTYTITPDIGYKIDSVFVNGVNIIVNNNSYTFDSVKSNQTIRVIFSKQRLNILSESGVGGSISPSGVVIANSGESVTYQFFAAAGFVLDSIIIDDTNVIINNITSYTFRDIKVDHKIRVKFKRTLFEITSIVGEGGLINVNGRVLVNVGQSYSFYLKTQTGYVLDSLLIDGVVVDTTSVYTFTNIQANHTIQAKYKRTNYIIYSQTNEGGFISPRGQVIRNIGEDQKYTIIPQVGYLIDSVVVDGNKVDSTTSYTFKSIDRSHNIYVYFKSNRYEITSSAGVGGKISPQGKVYLQAGQSQEYKIKANNNTEIDSVFVDGLYVGKLSVYRFENVQMGHTIRATFKNNLYTIVSGTSLVNGQVGGRINPAGVYKIRGGRNKTYKITTNAGFVVDSILIDGVAIDKTMELYTFTNVLDNHTIRVVYNTTPVGNIKNIKRVDAEPSSFVVQSSSNIPGLIDFEGTQVVSSGDTVVFEAINNTDYVLDSILLDGVLQTVALNNNIFSLDNIQANHTIQYYFSKISYNIISKVKGVGGIITPFGTTAVEKGSSVRYGLYPNVGYVVDSLWINGDLKTDSTSGYTFTNIQDSGSIEVKFKQNIYIITSTSNEGGTISPLGTVNVELGGSQVYQISPNSGYIIDSLLIDGALNNDSTTRYTFRDVQKNHTIKVLYKSTINYITTEVKGLGGSISPLGTSRINKGDSLKLRIIPDEKYALDSIWLDDLYQTSTINQGEYVVSNVSGNSKVKVQFKQVIFEITSEQKDTFGTITPLGKQLVKTGETIGYKITTKTGYKIDSLLVDGNIIKDSNTGYTFVGVNADHKIQVSYKIQTYTISAGAGIGGSISSLGVSVVNYGAKPTYTITPNAGYDIDSVLVNGNKINNITSYTFDSVLSNQTIEVRFKLQTYTISATSGTGGTISQNGVTNVNYGSRPSYTITPNTGNVIDSVLVNGTKVTVNNNVYTFDSVKTNQTIWVTFKIQTYTITATSGTGGTISPSGTTTVNYGSRPSYTITVNAGYVLDSVLVNGQKVSITNNVYTFDSVKSNQTIRVTFKIQTYTISATAGVGGTIIQNGTTTVNYGSRPSYIITANAGYVIDSVLVNGTKVNIGNNIYTFDSVKTNQTIRVTFKIQTYTITASAGTGGTISPSGTTTVNYGSRPSYTITPNANYVVDSVLVNGTKVNITNNVYTFDSVKSNQTIRVTFKTTIVCPGTKVSPNIVRVGVALQSDITTFAKHRWYLDGTIKDSTLTNSYTPPTAGVYTMLGLDANGCESNLSKKYYYSQTCIIPSGRLGNGATIEGNIIGNSNQIIVKWCTDIIQTELTLRAIDISGVVIYDQKTSANTGTYIIYKSELKSNGFYVQVLDNNGEIIQISDIIKK